MPFTGLPEREFRLLNEWQRDFPRCPRPYAEVGATLGIDELAVIKLLDRLRRQGRVSRVGAVVRPHVLGWSTLAAMAAPAERIEAVAALIDGFAEVNHNYEREHRFNLWFVVAAPTRARVAAVLDQIAQGSGLQPLALPMLSDYHIDLGFDLDRPSDRTRQSRVKAPAHAGERAPRRAPSVDAASLRRSLTAVDRRLAAALAGGLALTPRPYAALAADAGLTEAAVIGSLERLLRLGVLRRFGVIVRHRELGYTANAMLVWDVPDVRVDALGRLLGDHPGVSLCYRRARQLPDWPYNLFCMLHGRDREEVLGRIAQLSDAFGIKDLPCQILFSRRRFKQCGARYATGAEAA